MVVQSVEHWLPVEVSSGGFSSEYAVSLTTSDGKCVTFFADQSLIRESPQGFQIKVVLVDKPSPGIERVLLPTETFETLSRWVEVKSQ